MWTRGGAASVSAVQEVTTHGKSSSNDGLVPRPLITRAREREDIKEKKNLQKINTSTGLELIALFVVVNIK